MMNYNEQKTVIDLSDAVNISSLSIKISNILDSSGIQNKELFLNLGNLDLKRSQLLSIKALVEAMQSKLAGIETTSEMTEAAAIGLGLIVEKLNTAEIEEVLNEDDVKLEQQDEISQDMESEELSSFSQLKQLNSIGDFVTNTNTMEEVQTENLEQETQEFLKEVQSEEEVFPVETVEISAPDSVESALDITFGTNTNPDIINEQNQEEDVFAPITMQNKFEEHEVTETVEQVDEGKYVLLDTEGITPEGLELMKSNTSDLDTLYLTQTLRSGQTVSYEGNIFLIGDAHPGSEINATGDITVWGILGGIVHAGTKGNTSAKVRALKLNPIQLRIANLYSRRNDTVNVPFVQKTNEFTPEEARIENEQIVIYKTLRRED